MLHKTSRVKLGKDKFLYVLLERHTVLQTYRHRNGKAVQHAAHGGAFLRHVNEDFTQCTVAVFPGAYKDGLPVNLCFLRKATTLGWKCTALDNLRQIAFELCIR